MAKAKKGTTPSQFQEKFCFTGFKGRAIGASLVSLDKSYDGVVTPFLLDIGSDDLIPIRSDVT